MKSAAEKQETELEGHWFWLRVAACTFLSFSLLSFLPLFCLSYTVFPAPTESGAPLLWAPLERSWKVGNVLLLLTTAMPVIYPNELQHYGNKVNKQIKRNDGNWEETMRREEEMKCK